MDTCYVTAVLAAKPGMEDRLEAEVLANIPKVRAEKGCIRYDFHKSRAGDGTFLFYEQWESPDALAAHAGSAHMQVYKERTSTLLARSTVVDVWSDIDRAN